MKQQVLNDAIVTFADGLKWPEPLLKPRPDDVITRALNVEPAFEQLTSAEAARRSWESRNGPPPSDTCGHWSV